MVYWEQRGSSCRQKEKAGAFAPAGIFYQLCRMFEVKLANYGKHNYPDA